MFELFLSVMDPEARDIATLNGALNQA